MRPISSETFLEFASSAGIGYDPRYPRAQSLIFLPPNAASRFWVRPEQPSRWPKFVSSILDAVGANGLVFVKLQRGTWPNLASVHSQLNRCQATLSTRLGIPSGWAGALEFGPGERELLVAILVTQFLEPVNDLLLLPAEGKALMKISHHDVVHVSCANSEGIETVIELMSAAKFELPDELPDETFKRPAWMRPSGGNA